jgi:hypothetical protein
MVRFSNSKLSSTQYIVRGITPVQASSTAVIPPISSAFTVQREVPPVSEFVAEKTAVGISSTAFDVALSPGMPDSNVNLGLLYSNGYRYQYIDFKAGTTGCSTEVPDKVVTVQVQTDSGPIYVDQVLSGYTLIEAYVGNRIAIPQLPNGDVVTDTTRPPSKLPPNESNNIGC